MPAGRPPKPTHLKVIEGNRGKRALNHAEPHPAAPAAIPEPPDYLDAAGKTEWRRVAPELWRVGLLTIVDLNILGAYCTAFSRWFAAEQSLAVMAMGDPSTHGLLIRGSKGTIIQNPLVSTALKSKLAMLRIAAEFGMTPAARSRIALGAAADGADPLSLLMG